MQVNKTYKVAVIDEILVSHTGLCFLINKLQDFKVVDYQNHYLNAQLEQTPLDVLLYSTRSVDEEVINKLKKITAKNSRPPIVVLAPGIGRAEQIVVIRLGINGLITHEVTRKSLKESLLCAVHNGQYLPDVIMQVLKDSPRRSVNGQLVKAAFSEMQKQILQLLASGLTTPVVADKLCRSVRTIEWHKEKMMKIAKVASTSQLLLFAMEYCIIDSPFDFNAEVHPIPEVRENVQLYLS